MGKNRSQQHRLVWPPTPEQWQNIDEMIETLFKAQRSTAIPSTNISGEALAITNDTNVTATMAGTPLNALLRAVTIILSWTGLLGLARGGTNANLSLTGGAGQVLKQTGVGAAVTVAAISGSDIVGAALTKVDDTNVTLALGGTPATALLRAASLTLGWNGRLGLARGGTHADLSATGGPGQVLMQSTVGGDITVGTLAAATYDEPLTNGDPDAPEVVFDDDGDIVMVTGIPL